MKSPKAGRLRVELPAKWTFEKVRSSILESSAICMEIPHVTTADKIRLAADHLAAALVNLDRLGLDVTAAKLSSAIDCFKEELRTATYPSLSERDVVEMEFTMARIFSGAS